MPGLLTAVAPSDTVHAWGEHYGDPLSRLWERSAIADHRLQDRLGEPGLDLDLDLDLDPGSGSGPGWVDGRFW